MFVSLLLFDDSSGDSGDGDIHPAIVLSERSKIKWNRIINFQTT